VLCRSKTSSGDRKENIISTLPHAPQRKVRVHIYRPVKMSTEYVNRSLSNLVVGQMMRVNGMR
jgi:hypothetical protein